MILNRRFLSVLLTITLWAAGQAALAAGRYSVTKEEVQGHTTYHLHDHSLKMDFGLVPDIGNFAYEFKADGKDVLVPVESLASYAKARQFRGGIPFLEPFANRLDGDYYFFQGRKYLLNGSLGNFLRDQFGQPIHGLLVYETHWRVTKEGASDSEGAFVTSRLDFYKYPALMAQFPFAHTIEVTYRLKDGRLENTTMIRNLSASAMPVDIGYHPYFQPGGTRENWVVSLPARKHWILDKKLIPTGATQPTDELLKNPTHFVLGKTYLDDVFSDLPRDSQGLARVSVESGNSKIEVLFGKEYSFAVVYAPWPHSLICFEPYTGPTDAFNLHHEGKFPGLVILNPGQTFQAKFWIVPTGF
ncbi:MAG TPA: aldose 1-epimerase [Terriglobia bacterium]|nr:aldose 1-epimerase [Terriglobia bacterium]